MTLAKPPLPQISMKAVDRLLRACVRPISNDPAFLKLRRDKVLPLFLPWTLRMVREVGQRTPDGQIQIPRDEWESLSLQLWSMANEYAVAAEVLARADQGPSASELEQAPLADPWVAGRGSSAALGLYGLRPGGRGGKRRVAFSSQLDAIDVNQGLALTFSGWYRLGRRISGWEFQELCPKYSNLQECGDEELEHSLLAHRAQVAWLLGQLTLSPA